MKYIAVTLSGKQIEYSDRASLNRAKDRRKDVIVDSWPADDAPPFGKANDAQAWNDYRTRRVHTGAR